MMKAPTSSPVGNDSPIDYSSSPNPSEPTTLINRLDGYQGIDMSSLRLDPALALFTEQFWPPRGTCMLSDLGIPCWLNSVAAICTLFVIEDSGGSHSIVGNIPGETAA